MFKPKSSPADGLETQTRMAVLAYDLGLSLKLSRDAWPVFCEHYVTSLSARALVSDACARRIKADLLRNYPGTEITMSKRISWAKLAWLVAEITLLVILLYIGATFVLGLGMAFWYLMAW